MNLLRRPQEMHHQTDLPAARALAASFTPTKPGDFVEIECAPDGAIHKETPLRGEPKEPAYDEVWINDEGKRSINDCTRFKRIYRHALEKRP